MADTERIDKLIDDLENNEVEGPGVSSFGDTGYDPGVDFPVCRRAVEELVSMGDSIIPRMLELIAPSYNERAYFAAEVLGRLHAVEAVGRLEEFVRSRSTISKRVNYDQFIEYEIFQKALDALLQIDKNRAVSILQEVAKQSEFCEQWAKARLAELT